MAHPVIGHRLDQFLLDHFLPDDFAEPHDTSLNSGSKFMGFPGGKDFPLNINGEKAKWRKSENFHSSLHEYLRERKFRDQHFSRSGTGDEDDR